MVRFARIKGVHAKSSFNKVPEEASTWEELKLSLEDSPDAEPESNENDDVAMQSLPKKVVGTWSEFEVDSEVTKKKRSENISKSEQPIKKKSKRNVGCESWSEFESAAEVTEKKKNKKWSETETESELPRKKKSKNMDNEIHCEFEDVTKVTEKKKKKKWSETESESELPRKKKSKNMENESHREFEDVTKVTEKKKKKKWSETDTSSEELEKKKSEISSSESLNRPEAELTTKKNRKRKTSEAEPKSESTSEVADKLNFASRGKLNFDIKSADQNINDKSNIPPARKKTRKEKELEGMEFKRKKPVNDDGLISIDGREIKLTRFDGYVVSEQRAKMLAELRQKLREEGKDEQDIFGLMKTARRRAEKELKSMKKSQCFHCRKGGHNLSECPELYKKPDQGSGICFKCGSTEHMLSQCKSKSNTLQFATCFICNEKGHLSRNCSNNPRGLYPDGGGCKTCGDVTHYERDCPQKKKRREIVSAKRIDLNDVEALDYDDDVAYRKKPAKADDGKRPNKIIKFD